DVAQALSAEEAHRAIIEGLCPRHPETYTNSSGQRQH
ncbi:unnamed protein product, partial [marine sediment metagenome]